MSYQRILAAVDLTDLVHAKQVLDVADRMAVLEVAPLEVLTVIPDFGMSVVSSFFPKDFEKMALENARQGLQTMLDQAGHKAKSVTGHVAHGTVYDEISKAANALKADLIIMGAHRPELQDFLLGPNAARVVRHANQSVFIVRN